MLQEIKVDETNRSDRRKWTWNWMQEARAADVQTVLKELQPYWPITERQLYYRLISSGLIEGKHWHKFGNPKNGKPNNLYDALIALLKWMRIEERIPWEAITDDHRELTKKSGFSDEATFVHQELNNFLKGYRKCRAHRQKYYVEVWIEKHALLNIVKPVATKYCRRVMVCKGYNSITFQADFYNRAVEAMQRDQKPVVLYFGDWDPSGVDMLERTVQTLQEDLGLFGVEFWRGGINPDQFELIDASPVPIKASDTRAKKFIEKHGRTAYELDAFHPRKLQELVDYCIQQFTDMDVLKEDQKMEEKERRNLRDLRERVEWEVEDWLEENE